MRFPEEVARGRGRAVTLSALALVVAAAGLLVAPGLLHGGSSARPAPTWPPALTEPTVSPFQALSLAAADSPTRKIKRTYTGADKIRLFPGSVALLTPRDIAGRFIYAGFDPQIVVYGPGDWSGFVYLAPHPAVENGLGAVHLYAQHRPTSAQAAALVPGEVYSGEVNDADGVHLPFGAAGQRLGVTYLRLISRFGKEWSVAYDAIFAVGAYANALHFGLFLRSGQDRVFGVAGINRYIDIVAHRERAHP